MKDQTDEKSAIKQYVIDTEAPVTGNGVVQIAYLHGEHVSHSFMDSLDRARDLDREQGLNVIAPRRLHVRCGSGVLIVPMRNYVTKLFLDGTEHEWLLLMDTDMGFASDAVHKLLESADPIARPVIGGLCFAVMTAGYDGMGGWRQTIVPTMYKIGTVQGSDRKSFCYYGPYERDAVLPVAATGAAFLLIHRSVLNLMRDKYGAEWFSQVRDDSGDTIGEDITFCMRAKAAGVPIFVNTGVRTTHHKETWVSEEDYLAVSGLLASDLETYPELPVFIDLQASFRALERNEHDHDDMLKLPDDLDRYREIIEQTKPDLVIETGTFRGGSARWFADLGVDVVTIDVNNPRSVGSRDGITIIAGDSTDPETIERVRDIVEDHHRVMVVLDSDHSAEHVRREIEYYGPFVTPGCHLVVEDTIFGYGTSGLRDQHFPGGLEGSPLDPVVELLVPSPDWSRDVATERMSGVSSNPAGWWMRNG